MIEKKMLFTNIRFPALQGGLYIFLQNVKNQVVRLFSNHEWLYFLWEILLKGTKRMDFLTEINLLEMYLILIPENLKRLFEREAKTHFLF